MKFNTENEWEHFDFTDSYVGELRFGLTPFCLVLDNVKILESNSCNRDVRTMRTNGLELRIRNAQVKDVIREGCRIYNADGVLQQEIEDETVPADGWGGLCHELEGAQVIELSKETDVYRILIQGDEHTYQFQIQGTGDGESWERFMNIE
jgi:hypothetical protein